MNCCVPLPDNFPNIFDGVCQVRTHVRRIAWLRWRQRAALSCRQSAHQSKPGDSIAKLSSVVHKVLNSGCQVQPTLSITSPNSLCATSRHQSLQAGITNVSSILQASIAQTSELHSQCLRLPSVVHCGQWTNCMPVHVELLFVMNSKCFLTLNILSWRQKRNCGWFSSAVITDQWCCQVGGTSLFCFSFYHFSEPALH